MENSMIKETEMENKTYEFIGRLALALFSQNIKMSLSTLIDVLKENGYDSYGNERAFLIKSSPYPVTLLPAITTRPSI